jgi:hypothetical protein
MAGGLVSQNNMFMMYSSCFTCIQTPKGTSREPKVILQGADLSLFQTPGICAAFVYQVLAQPLYSSMFYHRHFDVLGHEAHTTRLLILHADLAERVVFDPHKTECLETAQ